MPDSGPQQTTKQPKALGGVVTPENTPTWVLVVGVLVYFGVIGPDASKRETDLALRFERLEASASLTNQKLSELNARLESFDAGVVREAEFRMWVTTLERLNPEMGVPEFRR